MPFDLTISAPGEPQYIELFDSAMDYEDMEHFDAAVAYATVNGANDLHARLNSKSAASWRRLRKRWLIGIDWCRSEPLALEFLNSLPNSEVKIFDGKTVVERPSCTPARSFHPKAFMFSAQAAIAMLFGSGNLSRNGLLRSVEVGGIICAKRPNGKSEEQMWRICQTAKEKLDGLWQGATKLSKIIDAYRKVYERREELERPAFTEDDEAPTDAVVRRRTVNSVLLRQLRACNHFWIEAGNLHHNRGPDRPGNQLMMTPMSRVFVGFPAIDLPRDTHIGDIRIRYSGHTRDDCSLRFSNNSMDVLTLPVPGSEGPDAYDQEVLLFVETFDTAGRFYELSLGSASSIRQCREKSERIGAKVRMTSGRQWVCSDSLRNNWLNPPDWTRAENLEFPGSTTDPWRRYIDPDTVTPTGSGVFNPTSNPTHARSGHSTPIAGSAHDS